MIMSMINEHRRCTHDSRVRGSHDEWSDFDLQVVVDGRTMALEQEVIGIIVEEEMKKGLSFAPVVKDIREFEMEKRYLPSVNQ
jgi:predicted nucleotidyltransferase